jgi:uncharacterized protein
MDSKANLDETWWSALAEGRLLFMRCTECDTANFYPRQACVNCLSTNLSWEASSGEGCVYAFTKVHVAPDKNFANDIPYAVILADMKEGFRFMAKLASSPYRTLNVGDDVVFQTETLADGKVRPVLLIPDAAADT